MVEKLGNLPAEASLDGLTVLAIRDYSLNYNTTSGPFEALKSINLEINRGQTLGLVGESGSGKTSLAWAIMRYLPDNASEVSGSISLLGENLRGKSHQEILEIRGRRISMVFQDPSTSLNPVIRLGDQIAEVLVRHRGLTPKQALTEGEALLATTGITKPAEMMDRYPHQASGGEKQRVVIATAFACNPELIIFDEPTTALDIITARQILDLFDRLREETQVTALYISHDLGLVSRIADDVAVIRRGLVVEEELCDRVFSAPQHQYTRDLIAAVPHPNRRIASPAPEESASDLLNMTGVSVRYGETSILTRIFQPDRELTYGACDVSLNVRLRELLGVVGESGSGKSTIAKVLAGLQDFDGSLRFNERVFATRKSINTDYRRAVQIVFQNPDASLNPRQKIREILSRPLKLYKIVPRSEIPQRIRDLLSKVLLPEEFADRYPHQLSGGEKQRVAIARAFAAEPKLVICDEITSSLDVSVQASVAKLLVGLQRDTGTTCIFITHDLNLIRQLAHRIAVMYRGSLVDLFETNEAENAERHSYTRALLDAVPVPAGTESSPSP